MSAGRPPPGVSVILPTRNRASLLARALSSLEVQTASPDAFEVIVVDNGSTDATASTVRGFEGRLPGLRYLRADSPGLHVARHAGVAAARHEVLLFGDDDIRAFPTWIAAISECFRDPAVGLAGGRCLADIEGSTPAWFEALWDEAAGGRVFGAYSLVDLGPQPRDIPCWLLYGCNYSVRRSLVLEYGGFHPDALPEDLRRLRGDGETGLSRAIVAAGFRARYHPDAAVWHLVSRERLTLEYLHRRAYAQGISDSYTAERHGRALWPRRLTAARLRIAAWRGANAEVRAALAAQAAGYREGLRYHQQQLRADPALRGWVKQANYIDHGRH